MTLGPTKHEKVARLGRISNVLGLREHKVRSNLLISGSKGLSQYKIVKERMIA